MPEARSSQAAGLMDAGGGRPARLLAMVCHGDADAELPLMWQLCDALAQRNYGVTVLDGTKAETPENHGLAQALEHGWLPKPSSAAHHSWQVAPARWGLQSLATESFETIVSELQWCRLAVTDSVLLVYATAETLAPWVASTGVRPLLAMSAAKSSLMTSYLALKRLWLHAGVVPAVVQRLDTSVVDLEHAHAISRSLSDCAGHFLGLSVHVRRISDLGNGQDLAVQALVQTLLEESVTLEPSWTDGRPGHGRETHNFATRMN
ncbi:hypothetical protein RQP54_19330 [Curvibacter sp. APW13]|uniref:hypothetical protein n=1 Tax=Curvibacter sp. APW13 TaxID=3077236 RepID=UPI0028DE15CA|nr:hypothetical protein [Curvibacter sp. APW13]MDT8993034.1 hypothetical protein [Curvibacter sp. APW13]